jgi:TolA-binding protein
MGMQQQWLTLVGAFLVGALVAVGIAFVWVSRVLKAGEARVARLDQARQLAAQQITQARKQVEQLQRENQELRTAAHMGTQRLQAITSAPVPLDPAEETRRYVEAKLLAQPPKAQPEAFPDTLVLRPTSR